jgi:glucose-6-phosphate isomerase
VMKQITIDYAQSCTIDSSELSQIQQTLHQEIDHIIAAQHQQYDTQYAAINLSYDKQYIQHIKKVAAEKRLLNPAMLIVVGIGGSNLGTAAAVQTLYGVLYNENIPIKIYFADTVDADYIQELVRIADKELSLGNNILVNVVTKSGTTTETIANFELFCDVLKKHQIHDYKKHIIITTDKNSDLYRFAESEQIHFLTLPERVGGRFSVLSAVGLFPLAFIGVDIDALCAGAHNALEMCTQKEYSQNPATVSAIIMHLLYNKGYTIHNSFFFSVALENLGKWYRQLMAESIGKLNDNNNVVIHNGMLPTVSIGSTDLHSVAQLYLSGPYNIFTTFISLENNESDFLLNYENDFSAIAPAIQNKSFSTIMNAILEGTMIAYKKDNRPFVHMIIPAKTAYYLGQFMQIKMCEIMYLGFLMNINPFDQPQVELYKKETKKILESKN